MKFSIITFVIFIFLSFVPNAILADPPDPIVMADGFSYEFGEFGEGLMKVYKDSDSTSAPLFKWLREKGFNGFEEGVDKGLNGVFGEFLTFLYFFYKN
jgi:hypothetical protein